MKCRMGLKVRKMDSACPITSIPAFFPLSGDDFRSFTDILQVYVELKITSFVYAVLVTLVGYTCTVQHCAFGDDRCVQNTIIGYEICDAMHTR